MGTTNNSNLIHVMPIAELLKCQKSNGRVRYAFEVIILE